MINLSVNLAGLEATRQPTSNGQRPVAVNSQSFAGQLSEAFAEALTKLGIDPGSVHLTVESPSSQTSVPRQNLAAPASPASGSSAPAAPEVVTSASPSVAAAESKDWYTGNAADDAYWSQQPPAVQHLRDMKDRSQRAAVGAQLASEGYSIDVPIMVWGWDPAITTQLRQSYGYTWVPSALQPPVQVAPGLSFPGLQSYDPAHPPAGSIEV